MLSFRVLAAALAAALALASTAQAAEPLAGLKPEAVVLFQGDSITEGGRWPGGDPNHAMGQDYAYIVAGEYGADHPDRRVVFLNRGISGDTVSDLAKRWDADTLALKPDLVSILVGVNDTFWPKGESLDDYRRTYDALIQRTRGALPGVRIILGEPFLLPVASHKTSYAKDRAAVAERAQVVAKLAAKYHLPLIHYQQVFDAACRRAPAEHWSWDGVHPTYAGHALMARTWLAAVARAWPG